MGQFTLLAVFASFLVGGIVVFNANRSADSSDEKVWEHQYHVVARDAASTGMAAAMRRLTNSFESNVAWSSGVASSLVQSDVDYDGGTYTIAASAASDSPGTSACPLLTPAEYEKAMLDPAGVRFVPQGQIILVTSTGAYQGDVAGDVDQSHQIRACYVKADYGLFAPPAFNYGFISKNNTTFNGGPVIQALVDGEGHIHANGDMKLGSQVEIDGHATYTGTGNVHKNTQVASHGTGPAIPIGLFDAAQYAADEGIPTSCTAVPDKCLYMTSFTSTGNQVVQPPTPDVGHRASDPFIWYIDGNLTISGGHHIKVPQYTTIVVNGSVTVTGGGALTVTGTTVTDVYGRNPTDEQAQLWVESQLFDGLHSPIAWYATGSATISGSPALVGNFYVNGDVTLDGGGTGNNTAGSFASAGGNITANGGGNGNNFWFLEVAEENVTEGVKLPGKQIVRLALAEWTDPVLDN